MHRCTILAMSSERFQLTCQLLVLQLYVQYMNNTLTPWPEPIGSNKMPVLLSGNADGIHSLGASFGPKVIGNTISNNGDDAVAIHGLYFLITKVGTWPVMMSLCCNTTACCENKTVGMLQRMPRNSRKHAPVSH